ncbi:hypothetical protein IB286_13860 [Spongiibacter sp. KMU-158]|uniref:Uncharacterized protein n=1 Tax=Spongiibacter pelagi TaxID=2760804 RepID=A0A927GWT1_9GAMM|nr:hypothetical protein [Spongiibacter pelagi]MBD2860086.1 hypothetical protein [Spongiibacter pelagi]
MTFVTILVTLVSGLIAYFSATLFQPQSLLDFAISLVSVLSVFVLICAWGHALKSLKIGEINVAPRREKNITYMLEKDYEQMYQHMINCYLDPIKSLSPKIDQKALYLRYTYEELTIAGFALSLLLFLTFLREIVA